MRLRHTLASIALAAPITGCPGPGSCPNPPPLVSEDVLISAVQMMPDPELDALLAACRTQQDCEPLCNEVFERYRGYAPTMALPECSLTIDGSSSQEMVHYLTPQQCIGGRRPAGYRAPTARACAGEYLSGQAALEAASVRAFGDLLADLIALGAPPSLRRAAISAAGDEVRHARACAALARRFGASYAPRPVDPARRRTLRALAIDNLVEGCVRETYGAVVAAYQARTAEDAGVARAMRAIARDEAKHAALAWRLQAWLAPRLAAADQRAAVAAGNRARAELHAQPGTDDAALRSVLGLPGAAAGRHMLAELDARVWRSLDA